MMRPYVVTSGLTRRLVYGDSVQDAIDLFMVELPRRRFYASEQAIVAHEASAAELIEFTRPKPHAGPGADQLTFDVERTNT